MANMPTGAKPGATFVINVDVFNVQVGVFRTDKQRCDTMRSIGMEPAAVPSAAFSTAHVDVDDDGQAWFGMVIKEGASFATWAHECVHIADWIMDHVGVPTDAANTEVRAYLVGHLFAGLENGLEEHGP